MTVLVNNTYDEVNEELSQELERSLADRAERSGRADLHEPKRVRAIIRTIKLRREKITGSRGEQTLRRRTNATA